MKLIIEHKFSKSVQPQANAWVKMYAELCGDTKKYGIKSLYDNKKSMISMTCGKPLSSTHRVGSRARLYLWRLTVAPCVSNDAEKIGQKTWEI
jgi:hypothetical protein